MAKGIEQNYVDYPLFKGLQRPLEFMGLQGRYIYWAAATAGGAIIGFIAMYCLLGFIAALIFVVGIVSTGVGLIFVKQKKGLHSKKETKGVFIYARSLNRY